MRDDRVRIRLGRDISFRPPSQPIGVSVAGSVAVAESVVIERFSHVMHVSSNLRGNKARALFRAADEAVRFAGTGRGIG